MKLLTQEPGLYPDAEMAVVVEAAGVLMMAA